MDWTRIRHFKPQEFYCKCCGKEEMQQDFVELLDMLRDECGIPLKVESGYRCEKHDSEVGGKGNHTLGRAVDLVCSSSTMRYILVWNSIGAFKRIGIGPTFIHLDDCEGKPQEVVWLY